MVTIHSACFLLREAFNESITCLSSELSLFMSFLHLYLEPVSLLLFLSFTPLSPSSSLFLSESLETLQRLNITQKGCVCANVNGIALSMGDSSAIYLCLYFQLAFLYGKSCICAAVSFFPCVRHYLYFLFLPCTIILKTLSLFKTCNKKMQAVLFC